MARWYISVDSKASGPYETSEVLEGIHARKFVSVDMVFREGGANWQSLGEPAEFQAAFEKIKTQEESRSQVGSHLNHPWILLKKKDAGFGSEDQVQPNNYLQSGPFSTEEVLQQIATGQLKHSDYAWKKGFEKWQRIGFIEDFDRMRDLDENSFINYKMPLPDLDDPSASQDAKEDLLASVQVVSKNSPSAFSDADEPEETELFKDIFNDFEVTSLDAPSANVLNESTPVPTFQKPEVHEEKPSHQDFLDKTTNLLEESVAKKPAKVPSEVLAELSLVIPDKIVPQSRSAPKIPESPPQSAANFYDDSNEKTQIRPTARPQVESVLEEEATQVYRPKPAVAEAKEESKAKSKDKAKDKSKNKAKDKTEKKSENKSEKSKSKKEQAEDAFDNEDFSALDDEEKPRRPTWQKAALGLLVFVVVVLGAFLIKNRNIFNSPSQKWAGLFEAEFHKLTDSETETPKSRTDGAKSNTQLTAQDPNLKAKTENQLESGANQKIPDAPLQSGAQVSPPPRKPEPVIAPPVAAPVPPRPLPVAQTANQRATWVDMEVKSPTLNPHLQLLSDGGEGTAFQVYISARTGELVTFPSFFKNYRSIKKSSKPNDLDLTSLPPGRYNIDVEIGEIKKLKTVFLKEDEFNKRIDAHLKQVSYEQQKEKKALFYGAKTLEAIEKRLFETARLAAKQPKEWVSFHAGLRQSTKSSLSSLLSSLTDSNRNNYAYPDDIFDLMDAKDELIKTADEIDRSIKQKKSIETPAEQNIYKALEKIRKHASVLSVRKFTN